MSSELTNQLLQYLDKNEKVDTLDLVPIFEEDHQKIVGALKSIQATGELVIAEPVSRSRWELTEEARTIVDNGSHEARIYEAVPPEGIAQAALMKIPNAKVGFSKAMSSGWILVDKSGGAPLIKRKVDSITDTVQIHLKEILLDADKSIPDNLKTDFKKRKLLQEVVIKSFVLTKGPEFSTTLKKLETDLTVEMLTSGLWKGLKFKPYNFDSLGAPPDAGHLHPLMKVRSEFRQIFLEMGFSEMPTDKYVESSFWNFDALFVPQQHPARDSHDTFFVSDPAFSDDFPKDYLENVKNVHSVGGYGSTGYQYEWKYKEAQKNLLRTHTTAVSARMLQALAQSKEGFKPVKYFSIDKVFRNETLDATHLAEFHQVEGVVADRCLTLGNLIGVLYEFFTKLGITQLDFKPAYNPYTEPSMEIFCYHPGLKKWIEVGNSGVFRPELLLPMGLPDDINVIAWGLSLERPTMIKYGINNIRDLVGPKIDLQIVKDGPICRLDN